jgi:phosphoglycolate phosphatase
MRILLWDIDGTLVQTGGAGIRAIGDAVRDSRAASEALARMRLDGMTDRRIARLLCAARRHHLDPSMALEAHADLVEAVEIDAVLDGYLAHLASALATSDGYRVLPGVVAAMDALEGRAVHALGTGNLEHGARLKLQHGGLWHRFAFGGYGSDAEERAALLRAAWTKAERHLSRTLTAADFVVIGDTPKDVAAAHANGFACVAVASGRYEAMELEACGADDVMATLDRSDAPERILSARRGA